MVPVAYTLLVILLAVLLAVNLRHFSMMSRARKEGKLPKGKPTMFDVRQLLMEGKKELAIEVYCSIFHTTPSKAKKDVEELQRSLKV